MGRELKRVPLDFNWPLNVPWKGYVSPYYYRKCPMCDGTGLNPQTKALSDAWYSNQHTPPTDPELRKIFDDNKNFRYYLTQEECNNLVDECRLHDLAYTWTKADRWKRKKNEDGSDYYPPADVVNTWERKGGIFGHDAINRWICIEYRAKRLGFYGHCHLCDGGALWPSPEYAKLAEEWEQIEPPEGPGYQLWENVSEGSPISQVFPDEGSFIEYLIGEGYSKENAQAFIKAEYAPSMIIAGGEIKMDIHALGEGES